MTVATRLKHFLEFWKVNYMVFSHPSTASLSKAAEFISIPIDRVITSTLLLLESSTKTSKIILCVHRLNDELNIESIATFYGLKSVQIKIVKLDFLNQYFDDCSPNISLAFGEPYGIASLIDSSIKQLPYVYFSGGGSTSLIRLTREDFIYLTTQSRFFSLGIQKKNFPIIEQNLTTETEQIDKTEDLFGVSEHVVKIVEMAQLSVTVDKFESYLHQHVSFFSLFYPVNSASIRDKFSVVSHVVTKTARQSLFQMQETGPLGLKAVWQNSVCSAEVAKALSKLIFLPNFSFSSELAFYCGLFHHFGYLVYGSLYAPEFNLLNCLWSANQYTLSIVELEKRMLTLGQDKKWITEGHTKMGRALLSSWNLDPIVIATARYHHNLDYEGVGSEYVKLIYLVDQLLAHFGLGDGLLPINENLVRKFGLSLEQCVEIISKVFQSMPSKNDIDSAFVRSMSAQ